MRITKLQIKDKEYKNLDIDLQNNSAGVMAFIGNNGSGKSNLLESLSIIFNHLYTGKEKNIPFSFSISFTNSGSADEINITKTKSTVKTTIAGKPVSDAYDKLPKQIVAIYSGEENRLWNNWYKPIYLDYISNITSGKTTGIGVYNEMPKMLYINKFYWHISLLCQLLQKSYNVSDTFCSDILNIKDVHSIKFKFNKSNYANYATSSVKSFVQNIDAKDEYTLEELNEILDDNGYTVADIYKYLYIAFTPEKKKMIEDIVIKYNDDHLEIEHFSEGEKKMLLIKAALEFAGAEDSLFILDEPDAHIHLSNKIQIKKVFENYEANRQVILTTHSPTLTDTFENGSLYMLNQGKLVPQQKQEILENVSGEFWNKFQQNAFIASKKPIILLVEGKHDKEHISNAFNALKEEYEDLEFEIFKLNTETNIQPFLRGLYESEFDESKLFIGLFDRENKILNDFKNPKNYTKIDGKAFFKIIESDKQNNNYFVTSLPELNDKKCDCSIEMMYDYSLWEESYQKAVLNTLGKTSNKSIKEYSEDVLNDAKNILSHNSSSFAKDDFKNFRKMFDLIEEIKIHSESLQVKSVVKPVRANVVTKEKTEANKDSEKEDEEVKLKNLTFVNLKGKRSGKKVSESQHLKGKSSVIKSIYNSLNFAISEKDDFIIDPKVEYIAFKRNNKNVFDIKLQNSKVIMWVNKKKGELPLELTNLFIDCSAKGHHGNGDYEIHFNSLDELKFFLSKDVIKQIVQL
ncbi:AAA family ATPase [Flavobacterium hibernum]|uniref:ATPase AAA-type core domain-containing protein n=1 Tax=Flavobacterium hibernum TaxID=37752 RepID=A0ABX4C2T0_9FLAO|nr:AAA family ATPase [Flavobacterium hibernum]OXA86307.1 hypothetical protein B0A73_14290 [Flavobacterium hibernum]STO11249.1 recombination protein F [Flavobacterium hibernum]